MNAMNKLSAIVWLLCILLVSGCERGFDTGENFPNYSSDELIPISVQVDGIENFYGGAVTRGGITEESFRQALDTLKDSGYDVVTTYETVQPEPLVQTRAALANVRFRLLAYKNSISIANYVGQCDYLTNDSGVADAQTATLKLLPGNYVFVCYSYGSNTVLAAFNGASATTISVQNGDDFMTWTSGTVSVTPDSSGQFSLSGISFTRQCSQLEICVQATGFPNNNNNVTACVAIVSGLSNTPANWSIGANDISIEGTSGSMEVRWTSLNSATVYSNKVIILPASSRQVTVKLTTLRVNSKDYDNKVSVKTAARQFVKGGSYRITLKVEPNSIPACNYNWAKANLKSSGVFEASQQAYGGYFGWNTTSTATNVYNSGNYSTANDPCYQVAPKGTWYTPSQAQLTNLMNCNRGSGFENGWYFENRAIFLPAAGYRGGVGTGGFYWSRTPYGSNRGYELYFYANGDIGVLDAKRSYGQSLRCVKGM